MRKLNKLRWVVAIAAAFFVGLTLVTTTQAATRDQGIDAAIYQGKNTYHAYSTDKFMISQIGGSQGGGIYTQNTYHSQVQSAMSHGVRAHTYLWYGIGDNLINARACMDYFLPRIETPKGSIVALDYEDGARASYWNGVEYVSTLAEKESNTKAIIYGMQRIKDAGYTPMYYSYKPYTDKHVNYQEIVNKFGNKCIWIAGYPDYQVRNKPLYSFFPSMNGVGMWQFTSTYVAGGLDGNVDLTGVTNNGYNGKQPKPKPVKPTNKKHVDVTYAMHQRHGHWLSPVKNAGSGANGFAGMPYSAHDMLYIKVNHGSVKYRVHTQEDGWLPWIKKANKNDTVNGVAGIKGHTIDGVQMYYTTPSGETYQQAYYRSQSTQRSGYLGTCADNGTVAGYDSWAGMLGEPLDRLQISINNSSDF